MRQRLRVQVCGLVQGVGFRPFVASLATQHALTGFVQNNERGVLCEVQGEQTEVFLSALAATPPRLAQIESIDAQQRPLLDGDSPFHILSSVPTVASQTRIGPDRAPCEACLSEATQPGSRRFLYPFSSCTECGPRLTIARSLPYDRARTTLERFPLCSACLREFGDPRDRRFHAQPMACPDCGPRLSHSLATIVSAIEAGQIVALKGVGGYHLLCDARRDEVVRRLRQRKQRDDKPLAVMVPNIASAQLFVELSDEESRLLRDPRRPIVLLSRRSDAPLACSVAPNLSTLGLMLPPALLYDLVFFEWLSRPQAPGWQDSATELAIVATSGNLHDEPLICDDEEAREKLSPIADLVVTHDRPIAVRCDDSVVRQVAKQTVYIRRARGYVPDPIALPFDAPSLLGLGGDLKATFCLTRGREAFVSQHLGDLGSPATLRAYHEALDHLCRLLDVRPTMAVADRHPDFASRRIASELGLRIEEVQHHQAHLCAVVAERGDRGPALGLLLDGFGLGDDGTAWGGELLFFDGDKTQRIGHLAPLRQPGGERSARQPWRLATAVLAQMNLSDEAVRRFGSRWPVAPVVGIFRHSEVSPPTTACGRYFQVAAAILGVCESESYEAEAAMRLESLVDKAEPLAGGYQIVAALDRPTQLDLSPLWRRLLDCSPKDGASFFHGTLAAGLVALAMPFLRRMGLSEIVLGGGCVMNRVLCESLRAGFSRQGIAVRFPMLLPPNDAGLSLGQVYAYALRSTKEWE